MYIVHNTKIKCILPEFLHIKVTGQDRSDQRPCRDCYILRIVKYDISTFWDMPPHFHIPRRPHYPVMSRHVSDDLDTSYLPSEIVTTTSFRWGCSFSLFLCSNILGWKDFWRISQYWFLKKLSPRQTRLACLRAGKLTWWPHSRGGLSRDPAQAQLTAQLASRWR